MASYSGSRLVTCPKCYKLLPEDPNVPVYRCGGCGTILRAKPIKGFDSSRETTESSASDSSDNHYFSEDKSTFSTETNSSLEDISVSTPITELLPTTNDTTFVHSQNPFTDVSKVPFPHRIPVLSNEDTVTIASHTETSTMGKISYRRNAAKQIQNITKEEDQLLHCRQIQGGTPFVICANCFRLLIINSTFPTSKQRSIKLQCGICGEFFLYKNNKKTTAVGSSYSSTELPLNKIFDASDREVDERVSLELSEEIWEAKKAGSSTFQIGRSSMLNKPLFSMNKSENSNLDGRFGKYYTIRDQPIKTRKQGRYPASGSTSPVPLLFSQSTLQMETLLASTLVDGTRVYGRMFDKIKIIEYLLSDNYSRNITTTCIVAGGGMGKTTIAQLVYCDKGICDAFENRMFISISENHDEKRLIKEIIEALTHVSCDITDLCKLEEIASDELGGKKFILIMDDAENMSPSFWYKIVGLLNNGAKGSTLMVTTKSTTLASAMDADHTYHLNNLTNECCWVLFQDRIFRGDNNSDAHANLLKIVKEQIQNYWKSPFCIKMLADLLHLSVTEKWWSTISDSLMVMSEHREDLLLALGYLLLPIHLKRCFLYCSLFPKNYVFSKQHLVRLWLSEGFIEPTRGKQLEMVGNEYFDDLIERSFFEHLHICPSDDDKFAMQGSILELAEKLASDKYFRYEGCLQKAPESSCYLSVVPYEFQTISLQDLTTETKDLRTVLFLGGSRCESSEDTFTPVVSIVGLNDLFMKFKGLISLDLSRTDVKELPNSIAFLTCLKYLGLNNTNIRITPSCISELIALQTLEAKNCYYLTELPETLTKLIALRHLDVKNESVYVTMPYGIRQLTNLVSLATFNVGSDPAHSKIEELNGLEYLQGSLLVSGIETITKGEDAKQANLQGKPDIESLTLQWGSTATYFSEEEDGEGEEKDADNAEKILENLRPNNNLEELIIRNYGGKQFPIWFEDPAFLKLVSIVLDNCCNCTMLPALGRLPSLRYLSMNKMYIVSRMIDNSIAEEGNGIMYPSLELLNLSEMYGLEEWPERNNKDFPRLRTLVVDKSPFLKRIPYLPVLLELSLFHGDKLPEISYLPSLQYMKIEGFQKIKSIYLSCNLPALKKLRIRHCKELSLVACASQFARKLEIVGCQKLKVADYASPQSEERKPPTHSIAIQVETSGKNISGRTHNVIPEDVSSWSSDDDTDGNMIYEKNS